MRPLQREFLRDCAVAAVLSFAAGWMLVFAACSAAQEPVVEAATCSPKADAAFAVKLVATCKGQPLSECPEADAIGDAYEAEAEAECSR